MISVYVENEEFKIPKEVNIKNFLTNNIQKYSNDKIELENVNKIIFELIIIPIVCDKKINIDKFILKYFNIGEIDNFNMFEHILELIIEIDKVFKYLCLPSLNSFDLTKLNENQFKIYECINNLQIYLLSKKSDIQKSLYNFINYKNYLNKDEIYDISYFVLLLKDFKYKIFNIEKIYSSINSILNVKYFYWSDDLNITNLIKNILKEKYNLIDNFDSKNDLLYIINKNKHLNYIEDSYMVRELFNSYSKIKDFHIIYLLFFPESVLRRFSRNLYDNVYCIKFLI
jgi:hypothetical protein